MAESEPPAPAPKVDAAPVAGAVTAASRGRRWVAGVVLASAAALIIARACGGANHPTPAATKEHAKENMAAVPKVAVSGTVHDAAGAPIASAVITASVDLERTDVPVYRGTTDAEGRFTLPAVPALDHDVTVQLEGYESVTRRVHLPADASKGTLAFVLPRAGVVRGRVVDKAGAGVRGASVTIAGSGIWPARRLAARDDGTFTLGDVPEGIYAMRAEAPGLVSAPLEGLRVAPGEAVEVALHMEPSFGFEGRVVDKASANGVPQARVWIREGAFGMTTRAEQTDKDGRFHMEGLRRGTYRLSANALGFVAALDVAVTLPAADALTVAVVPACVLAGRVVDGNGRPVAGARLEVAGVGEDGLPVHVVDVSIPPSAVDETAGGGLVPAGHLGVTVGSVPPIATAGTAKTLDGPGAEVPAFVSNADGAFRLESIPPGELRIVANARGYAATTSEPFTVTAGAVVTDLTVTMVAGGEVEGRVVDNRGGGVGNVDVILTGTAEPLGRIVRTDGGGRFRFEGVAGKVLLTATPAGLPQVSAEVTATAGTVQTVQITLESQVYALRGRTTDERGFPIGGVRVGVTQATKNARVARTLVSDADGSFVMDGLPSPPYRVTAELDGYALTQLTVTDISRDVKVPLSGGVSVAGQVVDPWEGKPLAGAEVSLTPTDGRRSATKTDAEGRFAFARIAAGTYTLAAKEATHVTLRRAVVFEASAYGGDAFDVGELMMERANALSGVVVDRLGDPVPGAQVSVGASPDWAGAARTAKDGTFRVGGLAAGTPMIFVRHPSAGDVTDGPYRLGGGEETGDLRLHLPNRMDAPR